MQPELQTSLWFARVLDDSLRLADPTCVTVSTCDASGASSSLTTTTFGEELLKTLEQVLLLTPHFDPEVVTAKFAEVRGRGTRGRMECAGSPLPR